MTHINQIVLESRKTLTTNYSIFGNPEKKEQKNKSYRSTIVIDTLITE